MTFVDRWAVSLALLAVLGFGTMLVPGVGYRQPRLVVLQVIDQLRTDYIERFRDLYSGGLAWLMRRGACFPRAVCRHSGTVTSAGHVTISTGPPPASHGIVGSSWRESGRGAVYSVEDGRYPPVGGPGDSRSPLALRSDTLGDRLKAQDHGSRVYGFSTKDRSVILLAGKHADGAFRFEPDCGGFVSSSFYGKSLPGCLAGFNAARPAAAYAGKNWDRLLADEPLYELLARHDRFQTEADGTETELPHGRPEEGFEPTLSATSFSDEITLGAALAALRSGELGTDATPDLLALGLSATDSIGHRYGPFSQEAMDNHLRLDRGLARLVEAIDGTVGLEKVVFALSADHGALPLVEHLQASGIPAKRVSVEGLWERARKAVEECVSGPADDTIAEAAGTRLYCDERALHERNADLGEASECVASSLTSQPGVEAVMTAQQLSARGGSPLEALFESAFSGGRSPHIQIHLREYLNAGTGRASAHLYDRRVPVLLAGAGISPGRHAAAAGPADIAPTLAAVLGPELKTGSPGRVSEEALRRGTG